MSTLPGQNAAPNAELLEALRRALDIAERRVQTTRTRYRRTLWLGSVAVVVCIVALARVTVLTRQLDALTVTQIGRLQIEKHLPDSRAAVQVHLERNAPELVRGAIEGSLDLLEVARESVVRDVETRLDSVLAQHESELSDDLHRYLREHKASIEDALPEASDEERVLALVDAVSADFEQKASAAFDALYPDFTAEVDRVHVFLDDLTRYEDEKLTGRERTQKRLIQTFLRLILAEAGGDQGV